MTLRQSFIMKNALSFVAIGAVALMLTAAVADVASRSRTVDAMGKAKAPVEAALVLPGVVVR